MKNGKFQMDMCRGPLLRQIVVYTIPVMFSTLLQVMFNMADLIVVGRYGSGAALAGVGAANVAVVGLVSLINGVSTGVTILTARYFGAKNRKMLTRTVHTSIAFAVFGGIGMGLLGVAISKPLLILMNTPADVLPGACSYLRICIGGVVFTLLYSFGSGIMRGVGDSTRPLFFIFTAGIINVFLNLIFVRWCGLYESGVALATVIANVVSAFMVLRVLAGSRDSCRIKWKHLTINMPVLKEMLRIGVPAGIQTSLFCAANMIIQSALNEFGTAAVAGGMASVSLSALLTAFCSPMCQTVTAFISQNIGGKRYDRMYRSMIYCSLIGPLVAIVLIMIFLHFGESLISLYNGDPEVVSFGVRRMRVNLTYHFVAVLMDILGCCILGIGYSVTSTTISLIGACFFRIFWIFCIYYPYFNGNYEMLLACFPVSWVLTMIINAIVLCYLCRRKFPPFAVVMGGRKWWQDVR